MPPHGQPRKYDATEEENNKNAHITICVLKMTIDGTLTGPAWVSKYSHLEDLTEDSVEK